MRWWLWNMARPAAPALDRPHGPLVSLAFDFSDMPGPALRQDGPGSAEAFREDVLLPTLRHACAQGLSVWVNLDNLSGCSASFLKAAFATLVQEPDGVRLLDHLVLEAQSAIGRRYRRISEAYIDEARGLSMTAQR